MPDYYKANVNVNDSKLVEMESKTRGQSCADE